MPTISKKPEASVEKKKRKITEPAESTPPKKKRVKKKCSAEGCTNQVQRAGVCIRHGANRQPQEKIVVANVGSGSKNPNGTVSGEKSVKDATTTKNSYQQTSPTWEEMFYKLILFQADNNGSTIIPHGDEQNKDLAKWTTNERLLYRQTLRGKVLSPEEAERTKALQQIGFLFEGRTHPPISERNKEAWMKRYQELIEYGRINGNFNPPSSKTKSANPAASIGGWCSAQRNAYKEYKALLKVFANKYPNHPPLNPEDIASIKGTKDPKETGLSLFISKERIDKLHALEGFVWEFRTTPNKPFDHRLEEYKEFQKKEGHGLVPQHYKAVKGLGKWVAKQRCEYKALREGKASALTPEKLAQLEAVNFEFCYALLIDLAERHVKDWNKREKILRDNNSFPFLVELSRNVVLENRSVIALESLPDHIVDEIVLAPAALGRSVVEIVKSRLHLDTYE